MKGLVSFDTSRPCSESDTMADSASLKIVLLGATGPSGLEVIRQGLDRGHTVKALVRNPSKIKTTHERLEVKQGNVMDPEELAANMEGTDVVISCLGSRPSFLNRRPDTLYTDSAKAIVTAMRKAGVNRCIIMTSKNCKPDPGNSFLSEKILKPLLIRNMLHNMGEAEDFLEKDCQDIDFTAVRPPQLTNFRDSGKPIKTEAALRVRGGRLTLPRADVARFMLDIAGNGQWKKEFVAIA